MKLLEPCKCGARRWLMLNGTIYEMCSCSHYQDLEERLESQRRAREENRHVDDRPKPKAEDDR